MIGRGREPQPGVLIAAAAVLAASWLVAVWWTAAKVAELFLK